MTYSGSVSGASVPFTPAVMATPDKPDVIIQADDLLLINRGTNTYKTSYEKVFTNLVFNLHNGGIGDPDTPGGFDSIPGSALVLDSLGDVVTIPDDSVSSFPDPILDAAGNDLNQNFISEVGKVLQVQVDSGALAGEGLFYRPTSLKAALNNNYLADTERVGLEDIIDVEVTYQPNSSYPNPPDINKSEATLGSVLVCTKLPGMAGYDNYGAFEPRTMDQVLEIKPDINVELGNLKNVIPLQLIFNEADWYEGVNDGASGPSDPNWVYKWKASDQADRFEPAADNLIQFISADDIDPEKNAAGGGSGTWPRYPGDSVPSGSDLDRIPMDPEDNFYYVLPAFGGDENVKATDAAEEGDSPGTIINKPDGSTTRGVLGGVRIAKYQNSAFQDDKDGSVTLTAKGNIPSNIGISATGVLFTSIPDTLTFITTITKDRTGTGPSSEEFDAYSQNVPVDGPQNATNGEPWNNDDVDSVEAGAHVGDMYIIKVTDNAGDPTVDPATIEWNTNLTDSAGNAGSVFSAFNGDMVVKGPDFWTVISNTDVDAITQDLQDVTNRGNFTSKAMVLGYGSVDGNLDGIGSITPEIISTGDTIQSALIVKGIEDLDGNGDLNGTLVSDYYGATIAAPKIVTNNIDFTYIPTLK